MVSRFAKPQMGQTSSDSKAGEFIEYRSGGPSRAWCENEIFPGTAEVELGQVVNKIMKRESYQLEAVQYVCASTGSGTSLNRFYDGPPSRVLREIPARRAAESYTLLANKPEKAASGFLMEF